MSKAQELKKLRERKNTTVKFDDFQCAVNLEELDSYYQNILTDKDIENALHEYDGNMDFIFKKFEEKTKLQGYDTGFLMVATMLQCARIYCVNKLTEIEKANSHGGKEDWLHDKQDKIFEKFEENHREVPMKYSPTLEVIIATRGVPYDATKYESTKYNLFKGANHRFSTLGHDPILGMIFGTANILTNTITCNNQFVFTTHRVVYDGMLKNPQISTPYSTIKMLDEACSRFKDDKKSIVAAIIKQLIHLATDMYTPCGIQLPGASLVLNKNNVEKLTEYISAGDILKVGVSAGMSVFLNAIIATIHGSKLFFEEDNENFSQELYAIRTKKIIMCSNVIATSSNVIHTALMKDINKFDLGGFLVTCYEIFNDTNFINKIKYEFINSELSNIYELKMKDFEMYY